MLLHYYWRRELVRIDVRTRHGQCNDVISFHLGLFFHGFYFIFAKIANICTHQEFPAIQFLTAVGAIKFLFVSYDLLPQLLCSSRMYLAYVNIYLLGRYHIIGCVRPLIRLLSLSTPLSH